MSSLTTRLASYWYGGEVPTRHGNEHSVVAPYQAVKTKDGWWLLRASNTQDVLVARAEAKDEAGLERLVAQIDAQLALSGVERGAQAGH